MNHFQKTQQEMHSFLYPKYSYRGKCPLKNFIFNANLQELNQKINYLCNLVGNGKISPEDAYQQIETLWQNFEKLQEDFEK